MRIYDHVAQVILAATRGVTNRPQQQCPRVQVICKIFFSIEYKNTQGCLKILCINNTAVRPV